MHHVDERRVRRLFVTGGLIASIILVTFGAVSIYMGVNGRDEVRSSISREKIVGTPDMKGVANEKITTGAEAKLFADGMRRHTMAATGDRTYAEMGRFLDVNGKETSDEAKAAKDPKTGQPVENGARNIWVTETALTTALNTSYFAEQVSMFSIVTGVAMLLTGIGFIVLTLGALRLPATQLAVLQVGGRETQATTA